MAGSYKHERLAAIKLQSWVEQHLQSPGSSAMLLRFQGSTPEAAEGLAQEGIEEMIQQLPGLNAGQTAFPLATARMPDTK